MPGPLHGIRILELADDMAGPWGCQILADMGAEVIKVEPPAGDPARVAGPARANQNMAALFLACNRNKRSLVLDLTKESARKILLKLAATADVVIHDKQPRAMAELGLGYAAFKAANPKIIFCAAPGYGSGGPYAGRDASDETIQAATAMAMMNLQAFGARCYAPTLLADKTASITIVCGVLGALIHRARTGRGQELEVPQFESLVSYVMVEHLWGYGFEPPVTKAGYGGVLSPHRKVAPTKDGYIAILTYMHWDTFCALAGKPELAQDARFNNLPARIRNVDALYEETAKVMATRTTGEWLEVFKGTSMPITVVNDIADLLKDPHLTAVGFWKTMQHPTEGPLRLPAFPVNYFATPGDIRRPAPTLGQHSAEILAEAGLSAADRA